MYMLGYIVVVYCISLRRGVSVNEYYYYYYYCNTRGVQLASFALFVLNILVFITILAISMCRYILYPQALWGVIEDREQILTLPLMPMAYSTLINMITFVLVPLCGAWPIQLAWILWWVDVSLSILVCCLVSFNM